MRFSIIIPGYNVGKYIKDAINSVLNQTYKNYELIVINDCSTDNTDNIIKSFEKHVIYVNNEENYGVSKSRNIGIEQAIGEYIIFLDADDKLKSSTVLEELDKLIGNDEPDIVYLGYEYKNAKKTYLPNEEEKKDKAKAINAHPNIWSKCWSNEFLQQINLRFIENLRYYEDVPFSIKGILMSESFKTADFVTHIYNDERQGSLSDEFNKVKNTKTISDIYEYLAELIKMTDDVPVETRKDLFEVIKRNTANINKNIELREKYLDTQKDK